MGVRGARGARRQNIYVYIYIYIYNFSLKELRTKSYLKINAKCNKNAGKNRGWRRAKRGANVCFVDEAFLLRFASILG